MLLYREKFLLFEKSYSGLDFIAVSALSLKNEC
jgi:hypothetical protein